MSWVVRMWRSCEWTWINCGRNSQTNCSFSPCSRHAPHSAVYANFLRQLNVPQWTKNIMRLSDFLSVVLSVSLRAAAWRHNSSDVITSPTSRLCIVCDVTSSNADSVRKKVTPRHCTIEMCRLILFCFLLPSVEIRSRISHDIYSFLVLWSILILQYLIIITIRNNLFIAVSVVHFLEFCRLFIGKQLHKIERHNYGCCCCCS